MILFALRLALRSAFHSGIRVEIFAVRSALLILVTLMLVAVFFVTVIRSLAFLSGYNLGPVTVMFRHRIDRRDRFNYSHDLSSFCYALRTGRMSST